MQKSTEDRAKSQKVLKVQNGQTADRSSKKICYIKRVRQAVTAGVLCTPQ